MRDGNIDKALDLLDTVLRAAELCRLASFRVEPIELSKQLTEIQSLLEETK